MWRSKKFIIGTVLTVVLLLGSIGGVVLAADNGNDSGPKAKFGELVDKVCEIYKDNTGDELNLEALKDAFTQARSEMQVERPEGRLFYGPMAQVFESLDVDQEAVQAAFDQARTELEDGTLEGGRGAVTARVLEILGIDEQDWQAACTQARETHQEIRGEKPEGRPFGPGFGFPGHSGFRGMRGPCAPNK